MITEACICFIGHVSTPFILDFSPIAKVCIFSFLRLPAAVVAGPALVVFVAAVYAFAAQVAVWIPVSIYGTRLIRISRRPRNRVILGRTVRLTVACLQSHPQGNLSQYTGWLVRYDSV